ncbi:nucleotide pyrophosphohydrolase [Candidatus Marinimicrobia bacterium]|jgi:dCTP diphosphatase|nr:nucleotide pyrophosphohydrolase [Candidatus Neomarinimicrobiota bacterium]
MNLKKYKEKIREFSNERDWDQFHDPKNLSMALSAEIGELLDIFQWLTSEQSKNLSNIDLKLAKEELGDIMIYLIRLSDKLDINLEQAVIDKMKINEEKYPVELSKGNSTKYNKR